MKQQQEVMPQCLRLLYFKKNSIFLVSSLVLNIVREVSSKRITVNLLDDEVQTRDGDVLHFL